MKKIRILFIFIILVLTGCIKNTHHPISYDPKNLPDLIVSKIELVKDSQIELVKACQIKITIKNIGEAAVYYPGHDMAKGAAIQMYKDGAPWGGLMLGMVDPTKKLRTPGASISYIWFPGSHNLELEPGIHKIKLMIDINNAVKESNEKNNKKTVRLKCEEMLTAGDVYAQKNKDILELADKLETCTPYKANFVHPLTGEKLTREIVGMTNGKCVYVEGMPNGGKMKCKYSKDSLPSIAQYYRNTANAGSSEVNVSISQTDSKPKTIYKINGKPVDNPMQECMNNGDCVISGY